MNVVVFFYFLKLRKKPSRHAILRIFKIQFTQNDEQSWHIHDPCEFKP